MMAATASSSNSKWNFLSPAQQELLQRLHANIDFGLTADEATARREKEGCFNVVDPPINCPSWVCCLLPCIKHVPAMKLYHSIKPDDAEVLRAGKWIRYDAASLVVGDIIRLEEGDVVPADCVVLTVLDENGNGINSNQQHDDNGRSTSTMELLVDVRNITGEDKPRSATCMLSSHTVKPVQLFWGGQVVQGSGLAVVTAVGPNTLAACLIRDKRFPLKQSSSQQLSFSAEEFDTSTPVIIHRMNNAKDEEDTGIALLSNNNHKNNKKAPSSGNSRGGATTTTTTTSMV